MLHLLRTRRLLNRFIIAEDIKSMPLEINEIGIRLRIQEGASGDEGNPPSAMEAREERQDPLDREEIVQDCVKRILKLLRQQGER